MEYVLGGFVTVAISAVAALFFIPRQLWRRWRERIVDHIDQIVRRKVSRFDHRYREFVLNSLRFIDLKGLATVGFYTPELDEVFVDVSLTYRAPHQIPEGVLAQLPPQVTDRHSIMEFLGRPRPMVLAVIGVPGSGKTTLLRHTARVVCRELPGIRRTVPILLYLRDHVTDIVAHPEVALSELVRNTLGRYGPDEPPGWFEQRLRDGDCVILLDGLDEVARQDDRRLVADWVERQTRQYPRNDFVITSRPQGYRTAGIDGAVVLQVRSFTDEQVTRFVRGWYLAVEKHSTGATGEDVWLRAASAADDLLDRLGGASGLYDLTVNPLLLTMIANVHRYRGALPGSRADLYGEICQVMLWRRLEAKKLPVNLGGDKKETLLRTLAFTMMQRRVRDLPHDQVVAELKPALRRISTRLTEEDFLADVSTNGLLTERESGLYSFAHHTFQEYLAAAHIRDKGLVQVLSDSVDDVWWRETTLLYAARSDADPIVRACLDSGSVTALSLAFDCARQGGDLAPELRGRLDGLLNSTHDDLGRQRLRTAVLVARHLRDLIRTGGGGRVCARPVSTAIYGLYLRDTGGCAPDYSDAATEDPITGVRASDAVAFVGWVNDLTGGEPGYRLPTGDEICDPAVRRALGRTRAPCAWSRPYGGDGEPELWVPPGMEHPNMIDSAVLAHHVHEDIRRCTPTLIRLLLLRSRDRGLIAGEVFRIDQMHVLATGVGPALDIDRLLALDQTSYLPPTARATWPSVYSVPVDLISALGLNQDFNDAVTIASAAVMGRALSRALTRVLGQQTDAAFWPAEFARVLVDETGVTEGGCLVSLDWLANVIPAIRRDLLSSLRPGEETTWAHRVASRLEDTARPVIDRREPLIAETATAIRLGALCLAAEADAHGSPAVGDGYRGVAAGVTLLQRRANGQAPVTEAIVLATS